MIDSVLLGSELVKMAVIGCNQTKGMSSGRERREGSEASSTDDPVLEFHTWNLSSVEAVTQVSPTSSKVIELMEVGDSKNLSRNTREGLNDRCKREGGKERGGQLDQSRFV